MPLLLKNQELKELMKNFYTLTGIRIVLFDENYLEIMSYPEECIPFCSYMRKDKDFLSKCMESDKLSFENCKKCKALTIHECHAGLIEATAPITDSDTVIGYIMFGQIRGIKNKTEFAGALGKACKQYKNFSKASQRAEDIKYKSKKQIVAAANILEACTSYILHKDLIKPSRMLLFNRIEIYISENIGNVITIDALCREFKISRTRLYEAVKPYIGGGIGAYIHQKRMSRSKYLLESTDMSITEIANSVGFCDYNYFLRCFKKSFGVSANKYRMTHKKQGRVSISDFSLN